MCKLTVIMDGSRIRHSRTRQPSGGGGVRTYDFARFSKKLHEKYWAVRGASTLNPPMMIIVEVLAFLDTKTKRVNVLYTVYNISPLLDTCKIFY